MNNKITIAVLLLILISVFACETNVPDKTVYHTVKEGHVVERSKYGQWNPGGHFDNTPPSDDWPKWRYTPMDNKDEE